MLFDLDESDICQYFHLFESMLNDAVKISINSELNQSDFKTIRCYGNSDSEAKEKSERFLPRKKRHMIKFKIMTVTNGKL